MFELIEIINDDATRFVKMKNMDNSTIEECFDDSAVVSSNNFSFMKIGQKLMVEVEVNSNKYYIS